MCQKLFWLRNGHWPRYVAIIYKFKHSNTFFSCEILAPCNFLAQIFFIFLYFYSIYCFSIGKNIISYLSVASSSLFACFFQIWSGQLHSFHYFSRRLSFMEHKTSLKSFQVKFMYFYWLICNAWFPFCFA